MEAPPNVSYRLGYLYSCACVVCHVSLWFVCCVLYGLFQAMITRSIEKRCPKRFENPIKFSKNWCKNSVSERPGAPLAAPWGVSGPRSGTLDLQGRLGIRLGSTIRPQKSLPESRRVAPGTSLGHFFEARGRHFHEKTSTKMLFYRFLMQFRCQRHVSQVFDRFFIDFRSKKTMKKQCCFSKHRVFL